MPTPDPLLLAQLSANSEAYCDPLVRLDWAALSLDEPWLPPSAVSLSGLPEFESQSELVKLRLSQYEFISFIETGLWLERLFIARLGVALRRTNSREEYAYHLHEIREEAGHSLMFLKLMERSGLCLPLRSPPFALEWLGRHWPMDSLLFWLAATLGEEVPDKFNRHVRQQASGVNALISQMCTLHMKDEARHIARARTELEKRALRMTPLAQAMLKPIVASLTRRFAQHLYLPHPVTYELSGLTPGVAWQQRARHNPRRIEFMQQGLQPTLNTLAKCGLAVEMPRW